MGAGKGRERITAQLLDAEADAFAVGVDCENHGFDFVALLVLTDGFFARFVPGEVREVHEAVNAAGQSDEHTEVGDGLDLALHLVALLVALVEFLPGVGLALLHAERNTAAFFVDVKNHDFDFVTQLHNLLRIDVLVGPVHFGDVHQAFDAAFDFNESTVVGDVGDLAEETGALRIAAGNADPRIFAQLLEAQRNTVLFLV